MNFEIGGYDTGFFERTSDIVCALERKEQSKKVRQVDTAAINDGNRLKQKRGATCRRRDGGVRSPSFSLSELAVPFLNLKKGTGLNDGYPAPVSRPQRSVPFLNFAMLKKGTG